MVLILTGLNALAFGLSLDLVELAASLVSFAASAPTLGASFESVVEVVVGLSLSEMLSLLPGVEPPLLLAAAAASFSLRDKASIEAAEGLAGVLAGIF